MRTFQLDAVVGHTVRRGEESIVGAGVVLGGVGELVSARAWGLARCLDAYCQDSVPTIQVVFWLYEMRRSDVPHNRTHPR